MRLINSEDVKALINSWDSLPFEEEVDELIDRIPTAYKVDDVTKKIREEIDKCNIKLNENPNTVNMLALCERRKALREALWYVDKDVMI